MPKLKNISNEKINVNGKTLNPGDSVKVNDITPFKKSICIKHLEVIDDEMILNANEYNDIKEQDKEKFIDSNMKNELIESFFNYHLNKTTKKDIEILKWFYKKIGFTKDINLEVLNLLDDVNNEEEFTEVLLNNIYPELLDLYLVDKTKE